MADAKSAAEVFIATCHDSIEDLAKIEALAAKSGWTPEDGRVLTFPLAKRGDVLERKSAWRGTRDGQEFVVATGVEVTDYETTNVCMVLFKSGVGREDFLREIAAARKLTTVSESPTPQGHLGLYEIESGQSARQAMLAAQNDGALILWSLATSPTR